MTAAGFVLLGLFSGAISGLIGVGGGVVIVPALVFFFGFSQHLAQGTSLALLLPPIGILAAWTYYRNGNVDVKAAALICAGMILGAWLGAKLAAGLPEAAMRRLFGGILLIISLKMILSR
jgi:uncharacterized protein